ncbi:MAG: transglutaminase domain-containing protein [Bacillota bacterium]
MAIKKIWNLEVWLLFLMAAILMLSVTRYTEHAPHWSLWLAAGLLAFFFLVRPKITGALLVSIPALMIFMAHGLNWAVYSPVVFAGELGGELITWIFNPGHAGIRLVWTFTTLAVFLIVYFQLLLIARGKNIAPLVLLGLVTYTVLWYNRFPGVESGMFMFFALAFPVASFLYIRRQSKLDRFWYKAGILGLSMLSAFFVSIAPWDLDRLEVPEGLGLFTDPHAEEGPVSGEDGEDAGLSATGRITGYSPGEELGGSIVDSHETVMRLEVIDGIFPSSVYLRGRASDYYTGYSWEKQEAEAAESLDEAFNYMQAYESDLEMSVDYLEPGADLFGLFPPTEIELISSQEDGEGDLEYNVDSFGNLQAPDHDFSGEYVIEGKALTRLDLNQKEPQAELVKDPEALSPFLQIPEDLPDRVKELALDITDGAGGDQEKAKQVENYLREFPYTRETPNPPPGEDFVDHFLFDLGEGYCSYYASAMVILLRINNVPARYVEGYRVDHYFEEDHMQMNPDDPQLRDPAKSISVRKSNAHAWVEAYLQGYGWVAYEPTARYGVPLMLTEREEEQIEDEKEEPVLSEAEDDETGFGLFFAGVAFFTGLPVVTAFSWLYFKLSRTGSSKDIYSRVVKVKASFGELPLPAETPGKIAERLKEELPGLAGDFDLMISCYHAARYSGKREESTGAGSNLRGLPLRAMLAYRANMGLLQFAQGLVKLFLFNVSSRQLNRQLAEGYQA